MQVTAKATRTNASGFGRIALLIAVTAMLAGCDKCGNWLSPISGEANVCREQPPRPQ
jgi:hypothetical protein